MPWRSLTTRIDRIERRATAFFSAIPADRSPWAWYEPSCPCGLPAGDCPEHPRARDSQRPPPGDWRFWLLQAGRGHGKTRSGAEWVRSLAESGKARRIALVGSTAADVRDVMVEGESGILAVCPPWNRPKYEPSKRRLTWRNGVRAVCYSADQPERLRGPAHAFAWVDEIGSWRRGAPAWSNLQLGLRLGTDTRTCVTYTPRRTALVKELVADARSVRTGGSTYENRRHLAPSFVEDIVAAYDGTRLGLQEIFAQLSEIVEGAWFTEYDGDRIETADAEYIPGLPVHLAIDCGTSRYTGAVLFQVQRFGRYAVKVNVFGDYLAVDVFSAANAEAIKALAGTLCGGRLDRVRLDPASGARTSVGPASYAEYELVFGNRVLDHWPRHAVADGLDLLEVMVGSKTRAPELAIHPRCVHLIEAFKSYERASQGGEWLDYPKDPCHPAEDLLDPLRGGLMDVFPDGRRPEPVFRRVHPRLLF